MSLSDKTYKKAMKTRSLFLLLLALVSLNFAWQNHIQPLLATFTESLVELQPIKSRLPVSDFSLLDLHGNVVRLSDYRGSAVLMGFWARW